MDEPGVTARHTDPVGHGRTEPPGAERRRASALAAGVVGVGLMAAVDEVVFHQLLRWHSFYDRSTPDVAIMSDGLLHAAELVALVAGSVWLMDLQRGRQLHRASVGAGLLLGAGAFQLFDGVVNHKLLRLHQVRYEVDLLAYDVTWIGAALPLLGLGALLAWRAGRGR